MGAGTSKSPEVGVPINPRVGYADALARRERKQQLIDAPVLVKLDQGTVRYRYTDDGDESQTSSRKNMRVERPHHGMNGKRKTGYFYHATLNDFSEDAAYSKEDEWKFLYVTQGPNCAKQKRLYYIYGKGLQQNPAQGLIKDADSRPQGQGYQWPDVFKQPGQVYLDLTFVKQDGEASRDDELNDIAQVEESDLQQMMMTLQKKHRVQRLKKRLSTRLVKPLNYIHVYHEGRELHAGEVIGDLRTDAEGQWNSFNVQLTPK